MDKWDEAAKRAGEDYFSILADGQFDGSLQDELIKSITDAHADLRRVYGKLVEFVLFLDRKCAIKESWSDGGKCCDIYDPMPAVIRHKFNALLADPDIQAVMKGEGI